MNYAWEASSIRQTNFSFQQYYSLSEQIKINREADQSHMYIQVIKLGPIILIGQPNCCQNGRD